jgi:hypothetical protein
VKKASTYAFILFSWAATFPWLLNLGLRNIPGALVVLFSPPPLGFQPQELFNYTLKVVSALALEVLPLASVVAVPWLLFRKSPQSRADGLGVVAHLLWIKSAVMFVGLALAQLLLGNPFLTVYLTTIDTFLVLVASPVLALASLGLLSLSAKVTVARSGSDNTESED